MALHTAIICLGSNVHPRISHLDAAVGRLSDLCVSVHLSQVVESDDTTGLGAPYLNRVARCVTEKDFSDLCAIIKQLEREGGRTPHSRASGVMPIDIDLVVWDGRVVSPDDYGRAYFRQAAATLPR